MFLIRKKSFKKNNTVFPSRNNIPIVLVLQNLKIPNTAKNSTNGQNSITRLLQERT